MLSASTLALRGRAARLALLSLVLLGFVFAPLAGAQERQPEIVVLHTATQAQEDRRALPLNLFFSLRDQNGEIVPRSVSSLDGASGELTVKPVGGQPFPPVPITVTTPQTPIKIALVIDRSGSMNQLVGDANAGQERQTLDAIVRNAAVESIKSAPDQAEFAVFSFAERTEQQSDGFLRKADQAQLIEDSIRRFTTNPSGTGNTCISDAALEAIKLLNASSNDLSIERKAVILFTDGLDKEADQPNSPNNCTNADFNTVIRSAQLSAGTVIPIYTIWPCTEPCDENQRAGLESLARETRGSSELGSLQDVGSLFQRVMDLLNSQWLVTVPVSAVEGENTATLEVQVEDGATPLTAAATFTSPYSTVFAPQISVAQQRYDPESDTYKVVLTVVNPQNLGEVVAGVYDLDTGGTLIGQEQRFDNLGERLEFDLPTAGLRADRNYFLRISATDSSGQALTDADGQPLRITYPFVYEPKLNYSIGAINPEWPEGPLVVEVNVRGAGQRELSFSGEIVNRNGNQREPLDLTTLRDGKLRFPMPPMLREATGPGEYELIVRLEDGENLLEQRTEQPVTLTPPAAEAPPYALYAAIGVGIALVLAVGVLLFVRSRPKKAAIPLPFNPMTALRVTPTDEVKPAAKAPPATPIASEPSRSAPATPAPTPRVQVAPALPTEVRPSRPAPPTVVAGPSNATVLHVEDAPKPRVRIKVLKSVDPTQVREAVVELPCTIGRENASFTITGDAKLSRIHVHINAEGAQTILTDNRSTNGTTVNEQRLDAGASTPLEITSVVGIGPYTLLEITRQ